MSIGILVVQVLRFYSYLIIGYVLLSWIPSNEGVVADIRRILAQFVEPYLSLFRRVLPAAAVGGAGIDFSPLIAILVLNVIIRVVAQALSSAGLF